MKCVSYTASENHGKWVGGLVYHCAWIMVDILRYAQHWLVTEDPLEQAAVSSLNSFSSSNTRCWYLVRKCTTQSGSRIVSDTVTLTNIGSKFVNSYKKLVLALQVQVQGWCVDTNWARSLLSLNMSQQYGIEEIFLVQSSEILCGLSIIPPLFIFGLLIGIA